MLRRRWTRRRITINTFLSQLMHNRANDIATTQETVKNEPDMSYLPSLRPTISTMHLMNTCIRTVLIPLTTANVTIRRDMEKTSTAAVDRMEEKVNSIMQRSVDVVLVWVNKLLAGQKKNDFKPRDDATGVAGAWLEQLQTPVRPFSLSFTDLPSNANNHGSITDVRSDLQFPHSPSHNPPYYNHPKPQSHRPPHRTRPGPAHRPPRPLHQIFRERRGGHHGHERPLEIY